MENSPKAFHGLIKNTVESFEAELKDDQQARFTLHLGGRDVSMFLGAVASIPAGLILFRGEDEDGNPIDVGTYYTAVTFTMDVIEKRKPRRFGFAAVEVPA